MPLLPNCSLIVNYFVSNDITDPFVGIRQKVPSALVPIIRHSANYLAGVLLFLAGNAELLHSKLQSGALHA